MNGDEDESVNGIFVLIFNEEEDECFDALICSLFLSLRQSV